MSDWTFVLTGKLAEIPLYPLGANDITSDRRGYYSVWPDDEEYESAFLAHPNLPVCLIGPDTRFTGGRSTDKMGIVIPAGTMVSTSYVNSSGLVPGSWNNTSGQFINSTADTMFGIPEGMNSLLVFANGGTQATFHYTALDVEVKTLKNMSGDLATASDTFVTAANKPVGIVIQDVYQTILPGRWRTYRNLQEVTIMKKGTLKIPYYNGDLKTDLDNISGTAYEEIAKKYKFAYNPSSVSVGGSPIVSDVFSEFVLNDSASVAQKVGRALEVERNIPFALNEKVQNYLDSASTSDATLGYNSKLFYFVWDVLAALGGSPTVATVVAAIESNAYGLVIIDVDFR